MLKKLAYKVVMFLIKHFLVRDAWLVSTERNKKGELISVSSPEQIKVVFLGYEYFGFVERADAEMEGVEYSIQSQCVSFPDTDYLYETYEDAADLYSVLKNDIKVQKEKIIAKGPTFDKKSAPVRYSNIGPRKTNKKNKRKK